MVSRYGVWRCWLILLRSDPRSQYLKRCWRGFSTVPAAVKSICLVCCSMYDCHCSPPSSSPMSSTVRWHSAVYCCTVFFCSLYFIVFGDGECYLFRVYCLTRQTTETNQFAQFSAFCCTDCNNFLNLNIGWFVVGFNFVHKRCLHWRLYV